MFEDGKEALRILKINVYNTRGYPGKKGPCLGSEKVKNIEKELLIKHQVTPKAIKDANKVYRDTLLNPVYPDDLPF